MIGRTFFFSSIDKPPGPMLTSNSNPPTIAIFKKGNLESVNEERVLWKQRLTQSLEEIETLKVLGWVGRVQAPPTRNHMVRISVSILRVPGYVPVVHENISNAQSRHQEACRPLCLESYSDHDTSSEAEEGNKESEQAELSLEDKSDEEEDEEYSTSQLEARIAVAYISTRRKGSLQRDSYVVYVLFPPVIFANVW
jgi:hypothetical protein